MWSLKNLLTVLIIGTLASPAIAARDENGGSKNGEPAVDEESAESQSAPYDAADPEALIYSVNRTPEPVFETARSAQVISLEDIWRTNPRSLPELLMEAGVFVQQTNYGGGAPIIRGLVGKQILILMDGVKVNNATYRFGPLQYLNTIDIQTVERVEVVRGPGSVLAGDALGAVINVITKKGPAPGQEMAIGGRLFTRFSGADGSATGRAEGFGRTGNIRYTGGITYRNSGDVRAGGDIGTQPATGYDEAGGNFNFEYYLSAEKTLTFGYQSIQQNEVPRTDRVVSGRNVSYYFDPQKLQLMKASYQDMADRGWSDFLQFTAYWNQQAENRQEVRTSKPSVERRNYDDQTLFGFNLEMGSFIGGSHQLAYGAEYSTESIGSTREDLNLLTGISSPKRGRYTDGASYDIFALYLQDRFRIVDSLTLSLGARYRRYEMRGREESSVGNLVLDSSGSALTGSGSMIFHLNPKLNLVAGVTRGFRAPNIDDVSVYDARAEGTEVPNVDVVPEHMTTYEAGVKYFDRRFWVSAFYYHSRLHDLLVRGTGTYMGSPFFDLNGDGVQDETEPDVLQKQNIGEAAIDGIELEYRFILGRGISLFGNYNWTQGDDIIEDVPLQRIPPGFGLLGFRWSSRKGLNPWTELVYQFAGAQRRLNPSDISDVRVGSEGTDGFNILNFRSGLSLSNGFRMNLGVENILDQAYKYHGSGLFRPGRQLVFGAEFQF